MTILTIARDHPHYPTLFRGMPQEPVSFQALGNLDLLNSRCVAVIGTRSPSEGGYQRAFDVAAVLARVGYTIVSGLAAGIDTAAHQGALSVPGGRTIAVLATTINRADIYPKQNLPLAWAIAERGGLLISEYTTREYAPKRFFERDRLQSALSRVVIPVQCGVRSGTRHTVAAARSQQRTVIIPSIMVNEYQANTLQYEGIIDLAEQGIPTFDDDAELLAMVEQCFI